MFIALPYTAQKMKFFIKDFFSKCDQIRRNFYFTKIKNTVYIRPYTSFAGTIKTNTMHIDKCCRFVSFISRTSGEVQDY